MNSKNKDKNKDKYKNSITLRIITIGNAGVGKTSIIKRYISDIFDNNTLSTIGIEFSSKEITLKNGKAITLKLMDTGGQEIYRALSKSYFKNSDGVLFVFALNNEQSFTDISDWINYFNENCFGNVNIPKFLIGNKCDLDSKVNKDLINKVANDNDMKYFETSAKDKINIDNAFEEMGERLFEEYHKSGREKGIQLKISEKPKKKGCACATVQGNI